MGMLFMQAFSKFLFGLFAVGVLVFVPAGTVCYPGGVLLMGVLFVPMFAVGAVLLAKRPALLEKRLKSRETRVKQDKMVKLSALMFLMGFVLAGLDFRFGWTQLPRWVSWLAAAVLLVSYAAYAEVLRENAYLSRTIEIQQGQKLVDTGLYGVVRHPMYAATAALFLSMPLVLGSAAAFAVFLSYFPLIAARIRDEEQLLEQELEGYAAYKTRVRYRLIPFVW